jgi:voltage-gated potassium channel Kch
LRSALHSSGHFPLLVLSVLTLLCWPGFLANVFALLTTAYFPSVEVIIALYGRFLILSWRKHLNTQAKENEHLTE